MNERLVRVLLGITSCATKCSCCEMHRRVARRVLEEHRASLSVAEAAEFDRIFRSPYESIPDFTD